MKLLGITEQIVQNMQLAIREGECRPGDRLKSEKAICDYYGISRKSVRQAYKILCENGLVVSKKGSGYYVADHASIKKSTFLKFESNREYKFGVILFDINNYFQEIMQGMQQAAVDFGCELVFLSNNTVEEEYQSIKKFVEMRVDGIIITPLRSGSTFSRENYFYLEHEQIPMVMVGKRPTNVICDSIYCDDVYISDMAVKELFQMGCSRVIHITDYNSDEVAINERSEGYELGIEHYYPDMKAVILNVRDARYREKLKQYLQYDGKLGFYLLGTPLVKEFISVVDELSKKKRVLNRNYFILTHGQDNVEDLPVGVKYIEIPKFNIGYISVKRMLERVDEKVVANSMYADRAK